jgi:acetyltransferase-like isoleucine patch superfamily enzyme
MKTREKTFKFLKFFLNHPVQGLTIVMAMVRGGFYILKYRLLSRGRIIIDFPFFCYTHIHISGEGRVRIGKGCSIFVNNFERLVVQTLTQSAVVTIGQKCSLGGGSIRCANRVQIGNYVMMAANLLQDVPFSSSLSHRELQVDSQSSQIIISDHVWLSVRSIVLGNSSMGDRSVLGVGAVLCGQSIGNGYLVVGNPARRPLPIAALLQMKEGAK